MTIRKGEEWGRPASAPPDVEIDGDDAALARWLAGHLDEQPLVRLADPHGSDLARTLGVGAGVVGREVPLDVIELEDGTVAANMIVVGTAPDRLRRTSPWFDAGISIGERAPEMVRVTTVVVALGQYMRGLDVSPRSHPGDGSVEVLTLAVNIRERRALRARMATGTHVPHPQVGEWRAKALHLNLNRPVSVEVDGIAREPVARLAARVRPDAYRLLL